MMRIKNNPNFQLKLKILFQKGLSSLFKLFRNFMLGARTNLMQAYKHTAFFNSKAAWVIAKRVF